MEYTVDGIGLNLAEWGSSAKTLFFLHYFSGSSHTWRPVMERLAADYRCLALDLRGWGDSDAVPASACQTKDIAEDARQDAEDARQNIAALGLTRYTLIGHSMGSKAAQAPTADPPPGLEQVLLVAPSPLSPKPMTKDDRPAAGNAESRRGLDTRETHVGASPVPTI